MEFLRPEEHSLAGGERVLEHPEMAGHMRLNHYMTKSRGELYTRICGSRYLFKYFGERKKSHALFVNCINDLSNRKDRRMILFAE